MPEVAALKGVLGGAGLKVWFWSNDHEPPHFMVKRGGQWQYKVFFLNGRGAMLAQDTAAGLAGRMSRKDRARIESAVEAHRAAILEQWDEIRRYD
jgi:hypothetical protein